MLTQLDPRESGSGCLQGVSGFATQSRGDANMIFLSLKENKSVLKTCDVVFICTKLSFLRRTLVKSFIDGKDMNLFLRIIDAT